MEQNPYQSLKRILCTEAAIEIMYRLSTKKLDTQRTQKTSLYAVRYRGFELNKEEELTLSLKLYKVFI